MAVGSIAALLWGVWFVVGCVCVRVPTAAAKRQITEHTSSVGRGGGGAPKSREKASSRSPLSSSPSGTAPPASSLTAGLQPRSQGSVDRYGLLFALLFYSMVVGFLAYLVYARWRRLRRTSRAVTVTDALLYPFKYSATGSGYRAAAQSGLSLGGPAVMHYPSSGGGGGGHSSPVPQRTPRGGEATTGPGVSASASEEDLACRLKRQLLPFLKPKGKDPRRWKEKLEDARGNDEVAVVMYTPGNVERRDVGGNTGE